MNAACVDAYVKSLDFMLDTLQHKHPKSFLPEPQYTQMHDLCCNFDQFRDQQSQKIDQASQPKLNVLCDLWLAWHESLLKSHGMELKAAVDDMNAWSREKAQQEAKKVNIRGNLQQKAIINDLRRLIRLQKIEDRVCYLQKYLASIVSLPSFQSISEEYKELLKKKCLHSSSFVTADQNTLSLNTLASEVFICIQPILSYMVDDDDDRKIKPGYIKRIFEERFVPAGALDELHTDWQWFQAARHENLCEIIEELIGQHFNGIDGNGRIRDFQMSRFQFQDTGNIECEDGDKFPNLLKDECAKWFQGADKVPAKQKKKKQ
jgi:hypothetical protein